MKYVSFLILMCLGCVQGAYYNHFGPMSEGDSVWGGLDQYMQASQKSYFLPPLTREGVALVQRHLNYQNQYDHPIKPLVHSCFIEYLSAGNIVAQDFLLLVQSLLIKGVPCPCNTTDAAQRMQLCGAWLSWLRLGHDAQKRRFFGQYTYAQLQVTDRVICCLQEGGRQLVDYCKPIQEHDDAIKRIRYWIATRSADRNIKFPIVLKEHQDFPRDYGIYWAVFLCGLYGLPEAFDVDKPSWSYPRFRQALDCAPSLKICLRASVGPHIFESIWENYVLLRNHFSQNDYLKNALHYCIKENAVVQRMFQHKSYVLVHSVRDMFVLNMSVFDQYCQYANVPVVAEDILVKDVSMESVVWLCNEKKSAPALTERMAHRDLHVVYCGLKAGVAQEYDSIYYTLEENRSAYVKVYALLISYFCQGVGRNLPVPPMQYLGVHLTKNQVIFHLRALYNAYKACQSPPDFYDLIALGIPRPEARCITADNECVDMDMKSILALKARFGFAFDKACGGVECVFHQITNIRRRREFLELWRGVLSAISDYYTDFCQDLLPSKVPHLIDSDRR